MILIILGLILISGIGHLLFWLIRRNVLKKYSCEQKLTVAKEIFDLVGTFAPGFKEISEDVSNEVIPPEIVMPAAKMLVKEFKRGLRKIRFNRGIYLAVGQKENEKAAAENIKDIEFAQAQKKELQAQAIAALKTPAGAAPKAEKNLSRPSDLPHPIIQDVAPQIIQEQMNFINEENYAEEND